MSTTKQVSIIIADDHLISRMGLKMLLQQTSSFNVIGEAEDGASAVEQAVELKPDVVIMDLDMPNMGGVEATAILKQKLPETKVLIFTTMGDDDAIFAALKAGANGYCLKTISAEMLHVAIVSVMNGAAWLDPSIAGRVLLAQSAPQVEHKPDLSSSKLKLLSLIEEGKGVDEIGAELSINDAMVKGLLNELLSQLKGRTPAPGGDTGGPTTDPFSDPFADTAIKPGDTIAGNYRIDEIIGAGGMGRVYSATHAHLDRKVAIKTMHEITGGGAASRERFKAEAKANAAIMHRNLATIFDFGLLGDRIPYLVMEYIDGTPLTDMCGDARLARRELFVDIFAQVCDALDAVHDAGFIHRDLKPSNIMIVKKGDALTVKLVDFGIAKMVSAGSSGLTGTGELIGTPYYMSPEQIASGATIDHRSDLYALGCTMYEALTGSPPFTGFSPIEVCLSHVKSPVDQRPLKEHHVPKPVSDIVLLLLEKNPFDRPSTAQEVRKLLMNV